MGMQTYNLTATVAAGATTATATTNGIVRGKIHAVAINYPTNTSTVDLDTVGGAKTQKILDLAAANTDVVVYPEVSLQDNTGSDIDLSDAQGGDTAKYDKYVVCSQLVLSLASATAGESVSIEILVEGI